MRLRLLDHTVGAIAPHEQRNLELLLRHLPLEDPHFKGMISLRVVL